MPINFYGVRFRPHENSVASHCSAVFLYIAFRMRDAEPFVELFGLSVDDFEWVY